MASRLVATLNKVIFAFLIYQVKTAPYFRAQIKLSTQRVQFKAGTGTGQTTMTGHLAEPLDLDLEIKTSGKTQLPRVGLNGNLFLDSTT